MLHMMKKSYSVPRGKMPVLPILVNNILPHLNEVYGVLSAPGGSKCSEIEMRFASPETQVFQPRDGVSVFDVLIGKVLPKAVYFGEGLMPCRVLSFDDVKKFASHFIQQGYAGWVEFWHRDPSSAEFYSGCKIVVTGINGTVHLECKAGMEGEISSIMQYCELVGFQ